jgi:hypothetical protein
MFCHNCGSMITPESNVCSKCGIKVENPENQNGNINVSFQKMVDEPGSFNTQDEKIKSDDLNTINTSDSDSIQQDQSSYMYSNYGGNQTNEFEPIKKKRNLKKPLAISGIVVATILVILTVIVVIFPQALDIFRNPKQLLIEYGKRGAINIMNKANDMEKYTFSTDDFLNNNIGYKAKISSSINGAASPSSSADLSSIISAFGNMNVDLEGAFNLKDDKGNISINANAGNNEIISASAFKSGDQYGFLWPKIDSNYYFGSIEKAGQSSAPLKNVLGEKKLYNILNIIFDKTDYKKIVSNDLLKIVNTDLNDKSITLAKGEKIDLNGKSITCDRFTVTLSPSEVSQLILGLYEQIYNDKQLSDATLGKFYTVAQMVLGPDYSKYLGNMTKDQLITFMKASKDLVQLGIETYLKGNVILTIYADSTGNLYQADAKLAYASGSQTEDISINYQNTCDDINKYYSYTITNNTDNNSNQNGTSGLIQIPSLTTQKFIYSSVYDSTLKFEKGTTTLTSENSFSTTEMTNNFTKQTKNDDTISEVDNMKYSVKMPATGSSPLSLQLFNGKITTDITPVKNNSMSIKSTIDASISGSNQSVPSQATGLKMNLDFSLQKNAKLDIPALTSTNSVNIDAMTPQQSLKIQGGITSWATSLISSFIPKSTSSLPNLSSLPSSLTSSVPNVGDTNVTPW